MSSKYPGRFVLAGLLLLCGASRAEVILTISDDDFAISSVYNDVASFNFAITLAGTIVPGETYVNPPLKNVSYTVVGVLDEPTPSGFPGFSLVRENIDGDSFYSLSADAALSFSVSPTANLADGLQLSELVGASDVLYFNAREFNQAPGRYHPPILRLNADGSGSLANANNQSDVPNPPPPVGSGMLVDVEIGEEYSVTLTASLPLNLSGPVLPRATQVPLAAAPLLFLMAMFGWRHLATTRIAKD